MTPSKLYLEASTSAHADEVERPVGDVLLAVKGHHGRRHRHHGQPRHHEEPPLPDTEPVHRYRRYGIVQAND